MRIERLLPVLLLLGATGCGDVLYIARLGWHQSQISLRSISVEEMLSDEAVCPLTKERICFIRNVKQYGEDRLGLRKTKSYSTYFEAKRPVLYVLTASEKDRLRLFSWRFPILGEVTYKSFFRIDEALKEKKLLERKGYDTFLQQAATYSTLGWLRDPIFSSMLEWDEAVLAQIVLHEMVHATIYFKGSTEFNEQLATFVGNRGAIQFLTERYGPESREVMRALELQEDERLLSGWVEEAFKQLSDYYDRGGSREEKVKGRRVLFQSLEDDFKRRRAQFKTDDYRNLEVAGLNNAVLLAYRRYFGSEEKLEALYLHLGKDLKRLVAFFEEVRRSGKDPVAFLDQWLKERGLEEP